MNFLVLQVIDIVSYNFYIILVTGIRLSLQREFQFLEEHVVHFLATRYLFFFSLPLCIRQMHSVILYPLKARVHGYVDFVGERLAL